MHDLAALDRRGLPGCVLATVAFESAAAAQATSLGFSPGIHFVPHPIQDRTPDELIAIADASIAPILALIQTGRLQRSDGTF